MKLKNKLGKKMKITSCSWCSKVTNDIVRCDECNKSFCSSCRYDGCSNDVWVLTLCFLCHPELNAPDLNDWQKAEDILNKFNDLQAKFSVEELSFLKNIITRQKMVLNYELS